MKRFSMALAAIALVCAVAPMAQAQQGGSGMGRGGRAMMTPQAQHDMMFKDITLTADQQTKIKAVEDKYQPQIDKAREEMMAARQRGQQMGPEMMQKSRDIQTSMRKDMRDALTADQQTAFDKNIEAMSQRRGQGAQGGGRPPRA